MDYLTGDFEPPKPRRSKLVCQIDDNEARAVQRLILDMQGQSVVLDDWLDAIICRYFYNNSWSQPVPKWMPNLMLSVDWQLCMFGMGL